MSNYWCHICMRVVLASDASTHVHDRDRSRDAWETGPDAVRWKP